MEKSIRFIQLIILVDVVYAFINLFTLGKFLPLIPFFEVFVFLIFLSAWIFSNKKTISVNYLSLLIGLSYLPSSEFIVSFFFNREWTSFILQNLKEVFIVVQLLLLIIVIILLVIRFFESFIVQFSLCLLVLGFAITSILDLTVLSLFILAFITIPLFIADRKQLIINLKNEKHFVLANNSFIGFSLVFVFHELVFYFS